MDSVKPSPRGYVSLLMLACQQGKVHQIHDLLTRPDQGVASVGTSDALIVDHSGRNALHYCAEYSRFDCAEVLLSNISEEEIKILVNTGDHEGFTPLLIAVINGNVQLLRLLIGKEASVNAQDKEMHTPVHWATVCGHYNCLDLLLEHKAEASSPDIHGAFPIHYAAQMSTVAAGGNSAVRSNIDLVGSPSALTPQRSSTPNPGLSFLQRLINYRVPVNPLDLDKRQPLLWAASSGARDACELLVQAGSDPELGDKDGLTALHCAASRGHLDCLKVLIDDCGAYPDVKDKHDCTPLMYAATLGYIDCIRYLNKCGADKNHQDKKGRSAAHLAASKGQTESIMELEDLGGNIWLRNLRGDFPLQEAAQAGYIGVLEYLLSHKPDAINSANNDGRSCLHIAAMQKDFALCQFLVENKINVNLVMRNTKRQYFTALDLATAKNSSEISRYLRGQGALDATTVTGKAVSQIQKSFLQYAKDKRPNGPNRDPNGILEEAFESGAQSAPQTGGTLRRTSLRPVGSNLSEDELEDELMMLETDSSHLPHLPREVTSSPTDLSSNVAKERHSDYDAIMDASVMGDSTFNSNYGFTAAPSEGSRQTSNGPIFSMPTTDQEMETFKGILPVASPSAHQGGMPLLEISTIVGNGSESSDNERTATPPPGQISREATPVYEMSTLTLNNTLRSTTGSLNSVVKYDTDSGSDEDMKHPQHRSRFMKQLMSQNDMSYTSSEVPDLKSSLSLKRMSSSRSYNSLLSESTENVQRILRSSRVVTQKSMESESVRSLAAEEQNILPWNDIGEILPTSEVADIPPVVENSRTMSQATQMTPRTGRRAVASRDSASSPRSSQTQEFETQTDPLLSLIEENSDDISETLRGGSARLSRMSSSSMSALQSETSELGVQTSISSAWSSNTVGVQTNEPSTVSTGVDAATFPESRDSARGHGLNDFNIQSTALRDSGQTQTTAQTGSARRQNFAVSARKMDSEEFGTQTPQLQQNETEVQTTPRTPRTPKGVNGFKVNPRILSSTQESQTSARGSLPNWKQQPSLSGLFTGDSRQHKNSSSGDLGPETEEKQANFEDDTLPDSFKPPILIERRKSRLRWDETAGVMPDANMMINNSRRASFALLPDSSLMGLNSGQRASMADSRPEHVSFHMPSLSGTAFGESGQPASTSIDEEPANAVAMDQDRDAHQKVKISLQQQSAEEDADAEEEEEDQHTEMYKKFRPPTPRVPSLKELQRNPRQQKEAATKGRPFGTISRERVRQNKEKPVVPVVRNQTEQSAILKNLNSTMRRFSTALDLPSKSHVLPAMPVKFLSSFTNTVFDLAPRSVIAKYLNQLDQMDKKGTRYNEPVVLSRLIPKYLKEMETTGKPDPTSRERRNILIEIRSFADWRQYLIEQLTNAVAPIADLMADDGKSGANNISRIAEGASKNGSMDTLPDIDQSSNTGSVSTKGSASLVDTSLRSTSAPLDSSGTPNGSPISRAGRFNSPKTKQQQATIDKEADNKLPSLLPVIHHPFPWR